MMICFFFINVNNINLREDNFDEDDLETINYVRRMILCNKFKQRKACKKRNKQGINASSMESNNIVELLHFRR